MSAIHFPGFSVINDKNHKTTFINFKIAIDYQVAT